MSDQVTGFRLFVTDRTTGEHREVAQVERWACEDDATEFLWTDGNYGCDCNRYLFFCRAAGASEDDPPDCGETRFRLTVQDAAGITVFEEAEVANPSN